MWHSYPQIAIAANTFSLQDLNIAFTGKMAEATQTAEVPFTAECTLNTEQDERDERETLVTQAGTVAQPVVASDVVAATQTDVGSNTKNEPCLEQVEKVEVLMPCADEENPSSSAASIDPFAYLQRDEFTSEIYKIEIGNLPKYLGVHVRIFEVPVY